MAADGGDGGEDTVGLSGVAPFLLADRLTAQAVTGP